jgi:hypothetical protein
MNQSDRLPFGDDAPEADVAEQLIPVDEADDERGLDAARVSIARDWDAANEADLIEQAITVPDDDSEFDR